jgi:hypothetical protein
VERRGSEGFAFKVYTLSKLRQRQVDPLATKIWRERASQLEVDKLSARAKVLPICDRNDGVWLRRQGSPGYSPLQSARPDGD